MDKTLVLLAAGMGSRYGGLKQLDQLGPHGETLMDYSIFDALRAGFTKIVFIIRRDIEEEFKRVVGSRYEHAVDVAYAFQSLDDLPGGFSVPEGRTKPWGTGQAVYAAREIVKTPFAVINSDDFYGADGYRKLAKGLDAAANEYCMCGFYLRNTLSENGSVSRGICSLNADGTLKDVVEHTKIEKSGGKILSTLEDGSRVEFTGREIVSMNMWGLPLGFLDELEKRFPQFLDSVEPGDLKAEFLLPQIIDELIQAGRARVKVLPTPDKWYGVTYKEDRQAVSDALRAMVESGIYKEKLF